MRRIGLLFGLLACHLMAVKSIARSATRLIEEHQAPNLRALIPSELLCSPLVGNADGQCSSNSNCRCLPLPSAEFVGLCAAPSVACSSLTPCEDDNVSCLKPYTICLRQHQCDNIDRPVCYPLSALYPDACPPSPIYENTTAMLTTATTEPTTTTTTQSTTTTATTTTRAAVTLALTTTAPSSSLCNCLSWNPIATTVARALPGALQQLNPWSVVVDSQMNIYVADSTNYRIQKYIPRDSTIETVLKNGTNLVNRVTGLFLDAAQQNLYYCDANSGTIRKLSLGNRTATVAVVGQYNSNAMNRIATCDFFYVDKNENIFVSDTNNNRVMKFTPGVEYGKLVAGDGSAGADYYHLNKPQSIYVDEQSSDIYVIDSANKRLQRWTDGDFWAGGHTVAVHSNFTSAYGLILDQCGHILVSNYYESTILQYPVSGGQQPVIIAGTGVRGTASNQLNYPYGITFDQSMNLYVSDLGNGRIQRFKAQPRQNCTA